MISAIIGLTTLAMASASDRATQVKSSIALGQVPDLTDLIDARGLKIVANRVNAMDDSDTKELMLRGIDRWLHRTVWVDSPEEAIKQSKRDLANAKGAYIKLFDTLVVASSKVLAELPYSKREIGRGAFPIQAVLTGYPEPGMYEAGPKNIHCVYWRIQFVDLDRQRLKMYKDPYIFGPDYLVRT